MKTDTDIRDALTSEQALLATLYAEIRSGTPNGILAVGWVIRNRVIDRRWPDTFKGVCLQPAQFSCWWEASANKSATYAYAERLIEGVPDQSPLSLELGWCAQAILTGAVRDLTRGANHYLTRTLYDDGTVKWATGRPVVCEYDGHVFLRL